MLNIAHAVVTEGVNGPGRRFTVWVQGCRRGCPGCFNPGLQPSGLLRIVSAQELAEEARAAAPIEGVTLSGGEPFDQASHLSAFLDALRSEASSAELTMIAFSGYRLEELRAGPAPWQELLARLDLLVDGPFLEEEPCDLPLLSSRNQRLISLTAPGKSLASRLVGEGKASFEVTITAEGDVILAGYPPPEVRRRLAERFSSGESKGGA